MRLAVIIAYTLFCCCALSAVGPEEEAVLKDLYHFSVQVPWATIKVRAIVLLKDTPWSEDMIRNEVMAKSQLMREAQPELQRNLPKALRDSQLLALSNSVVAAHSGVRWLLYEESKVPNYYRLDIRDFHQTEPVINDELMYSNIPTSYHINNYGRKEASYRSALAAHGQIILDNAPTPSRWAQEDLFVAKYQEGRAALALVPLLSEALTSGQRDSILREARQEDIGVIMRLPLDESKVSALLAGRMARYKARVSKGDKSGMWSLDVVPEGAGGEKATARWEIDQHLPYLVSRVDVRAGQARYLSERSGLKELGFPAVWRVETVDAAGVARVKEIRILWATTNVDITAVVVTNYPAGVEVWERTGASSMRALAGVTTPVLTQTTKAIYNWYRYRSVFLWVLLLMPTALLVTALIRAKKARTLHED